MLKTCYIAVIISILLCHGPQASKARPSDLDTSVFSLDYDYDSEPYLPTSLGLKEAKMVDPWTLDFRHKLASREHIGKSQCQLYMFQIYTQIIFSELNMYTGVLL